jgi:hypothetical protein
LKGLVDVLSGEFDGIGDSLWSEKDTLGCGVADEARDVRRIVSTEKGMLGETDWVERGFDIFDV